MKLMLISVIVFAVLVCCLIGIATRPLEYLALLWPANAALLALFLRFPHLNNLGGWLGAFSAFMFADLVTGNGLLHSLFLTLSNLISTIVSIFFIRYFKINYKYYNTGYTFVHLFGIFAFAGCLASAAFAVLTLPNLPNSFMTKENLWIDFGLWCTGEMVNYIVFLPLILAFPRIKDLQYLFKTVVKNVIISAIFTGIFSRGLCYHYQYFCRPGRNALPFGCTDLGCIDLSPVYHDHDQCFCHHFDLLQPDTVLCNQSHHTGRFHDLYFTADRAVYAGLISAHPVYYQPKPQ